MVELRADAELRSHIDVLRDEAIKGTVTPEVDAE
jgi:hypothetical protein